MSLTYEQPHPGGLEVEPNPGHSPVSPLKGSVPGGREVPVPVATQPSGLEFCFFSLGSREDNLHQILAFCRLTALQIDLMEQGKSTSGGHF